MQHDLPAPSANNTPTELNTNTHGQRIRSFNIEDFNKLVSTALDMQRLPDSSLALSLKTTANTRSLSRRQVTADTIQPFNILKSFKDALRRKDVAENASERGTATRHPHLSRLSGTRNPASSSVPALPPTINYSGRIPYSPSLTDVDEYDSDASGSDPLTSAPETPATPFGLLHAFPRDPWSQYETPVSDTAQQSDVPHERTRTKSTHKNFFKSLPFPKLKRKPSHLLFSSGSPPSPSIVGTPPDSFPTRESEISHTESDGMRSFFDDSGYEEEELASFKSVRKAKSRPGIRHFFSAPSTVFDSSLLVSNQDVQYRASKPLPPTPTTPSFDLQAKDRVMVAQVPILSEITTSSAMGKIQVTRHEYASPFYAPPSLPHRPAPRPRKILQEKDAKGRVGLRHLSSHERSPFERLSRSMDLVRVPVRIRNRHSPSPFPSPTSPLPPTPDMLPSQLRTKTSMSSFGPFGLDEETSENMSCESADQSIDSIEILSWRTKGLQKRSSKTSSGSAHARGKPSRNSIRERFGLGPQLHIHVSGPEAGRSHSLADDDLEDPYVRTRTTSTLTLRPTTRVNTSTEVSTVRTLTSMSVSSLRDSSTGCNQTSSNTSDAGCYSDAFDLQEDPFAADPLSTPTISTPPSLIGEQGSVQSMKLRSFMALGNDSKPVSVGAPETPNLWGSLLRLRQSSPSLATSRVTVSPGLPGYSSSLSCTSVASPSSVRSGLPPSLVDALGEREGTPSPSGSPRRPNLSLALNQLLLRTKGSQRFRKDSAISKLSQVSEGNISGGSPEIAGHSDSRPHSPFPLLFFRSAASKPSPITKEACLGSLSPETTGPVGDTEIHPPCSPVFPAKELQPISAQDADAFGDACRRYSEFSMGCPLDISTPVPPFKELNEELTTKETEGENVLRLTLNCTEVESESTASSSDYVGAKEDVQPSCNGEEEAVADNNEDVRVSKQTWPLPPLRTVVLDQENGEGWHDVDQMIEHVSLHANVPDAPRHTIRLPMTYRSGSYRSSSSKGSSSGSSRSRRLDAQQARKIIETLHHTLEPPQPHSESSLTSPAKDSSIPTHRRSLSVDSEFSILSSDTGSHSTQTCGSAYYSVQSSYSLHSKKSFSKSAALRRAMVTNNSPATPTSSQRPGSGRGAKSPAPSSFSHDRSASFTSGSPTSIKVTIANKVINSVALPRRISLLDGDVINTMTIAAEGWTRLMAFCSHHESFCIEAGKDTAMLWISIEEVVITSETTEFYMPAIPGSLPASNIHVLMTLTPNAPKQEELGRDTPVLPRNPDLTFCLPLPVTLGEVAEHSRRSSVGEGFAGL